MHPQFAHAHIRLRPSSLRAVAHLPDTTPPTAQVNHQGTIIWHGQVNRRGLLNAVASVLKAEADRQEKLAGGGATPSKEGKKNL